MSIRFMNPQTLPRSVAHSLHDCLRVMPAVVVTGARQTGKSTMAQELVPGGRRFLSLDDFDVIDMARRNPEALVGGTQPVTLAALPDFRRLMRAACLRLGQLVNQTELSRDVVLPQPMVEPRDTASGASQHSLDMARALRFLRREEEYTLTQAALQFILMHPGATVVLGGFSALEHLEEAVHVSGAGPLAPELMARVERTWRANFGVPTRRGDA